MKIAVVVPSLKNQAPIKIALSIAEGAANLGNSVSVYFFDDGVELDVLPGINVKKLDFWRKYDFSSYDIVHSHLFRADVFVSINKLIGKGGCSVSTLHNYVYAELKNYYNIGVSLLFGSLWNLSWLNFQALTVLTNDSFAYYSKISLNKKLHKIYNGHDILVNYDAFDESISEKILELKRRNLSVIGTYCNLIRRKNIHLLIEHVSRVNSSSLVVFGSGVEKEKLKNLALELNVSDRVLFFESRDDAHQYNYFFDLYAIPSSDEGFGLALVEAALHKKKILCSNISVFQELFADDEVYFFDLDSSMSLDFEINRALSSQFNDSAFNKATRLYSKGVMVGAYMKLYHDLLGD